MVVKRLLCPERVRKLPPRFSWVDQRLVRDRHIERCDAPAAALYLMLVTVGDAQGLSSLLSKIALQRVTTPWNYKHLGQVMRGFQDRAPVCCPS